MSGFVKIDCGIVDSSIWIERDQRSLFFTALIMARPVVTEEPLPALCLDRNEPNGFVVPPGRYGFVRASGSGIVRRDGIPDFEAGMAALRALCSPDPESRTPDYDGRRMARVDGGFIVLNYMVYRDMDYTAAERMRRMRARRREGDVTVLRRNAVTARDSYASASSSACAVGSSTTAYQEKEPVGRESADGLNVGDGQGGEQWVHFGPCHEIVVGVVRSMKVPAAFLASLRMHLAGELQHEIATPDQLGLAVQQWAGMNEARFDGRFFAGIVRGVKRRMEIAGNRQRNAAETKYIETEEHERRQREREEREGKLLAYGRREQPARMRELEHIADGQVPKKYQADTRALMVHGVLVDLCRKEWPDAR